jgi:hypothetical protein
MLNLLARIAHERCISFNTALDQLKRTYPIYKHRDGVYRFDGLGDVVELITSGNRLELRIDYYHFEVQDRIPARLLPHKQD